MTRSDIESLKAAFLARGGAVTVAPVGVAYGVDAATDKVKRVESRYQREEQGAERKAERKAESVREAYHVGGRRAAIEALQGERYQDSNYYD